MINSTMTNSTIVLICSSDSFTIKSGILYFLLNFVIAVFGAFGNLCSLWCLFKCDKTSSAAKLQLVTFFGFQFLVCVLSLPGFSYVKLMALLCRANELSMEIKLFFLISHTIFLPMERMNFAIMAIMRLFAVRWNNGYKKFVQMPNVICLEIFIFLFIISPWIVYFSIGIHKIYPIEDQMTVSFSSGKSSIIRGLYLIHAINHLFPTFISFIAYSLMIYTMIKKKMVVFFGRATALTKSKSSSIIENLSYTIRLLILVNILLDLPHTLSHLLKVSQIPSLFIHCIFYSHLTFDPLIFVGMNVYYRNLIGLIFKKDNTNSSLNFCKKKKNDNDDDDDNDDDCIKYPPFHRAIVIPSEKAIIPSEKAIIHSFPLTTIGTTMMT